MSETITASLTVSGGDTITVNLNTAARGPEGPAGGGGASTWDEITGTATSIPFEPTAAPAHSEGLVFYDEVDKSLTYYNDEAEVSMNLGLEMWVRVRNDSGATITNGKVVYINDAQGQLPTIRLARANAEATSRVIGIATHDIENNSNGYVTTSGMVKGLNTSAFQDGDLLFLSSATAGEMTTTAPTAPNRAVQVAIVAHAHVSQGKLYCHPENDSVASTGIVDSTTTGRALLTAATQSDARTTGLGSGATGDALFTAANLESVRSTIERRVFVKPTDTTKNNDGSPTADPYFQNIPVDAGVYRIYVELMGTSNATAGLLIRLAHPANSRPSSYLAAIAYGAALSGATVLATGTTTTLPNMNANGTRANHGFLDYTFASSGTISVEWAQNTATVVDTILRAGSYLIVEKLA